MLYIDDAIITFPICVNYWVKITWTGAPISGIVTNITEAANQRCSKEKVFWKYAANLLESTHANVWFQ